MRGPPQQANTKRDVKKLGEKMTAFEDALKALATSIKKSVQQVASAIKSEQAQQRAACLKDQKERAGKYKTLVKDCLQGGASY